MNDLTDRSRILAYQLCPRARYWGYEYGRDEGKGVADGVTPVAPNLPLMIGQAVHEGLAVLLDGSRDDGPKIGAAEVASTARNLLRAFEAIEGMDSDTIDEAVALSEGLVYAYALVRLPKLLAEYEVLEVEKEYEAELADGLTLMARPDALLRHRETGELFIQSFKTAKRWGKREEAEYQNDVQGMSELWAVEEVLGIRYAKAALQAFESSGFGPSMFNVASKRGEASEMLRLAERAEQWAGRLRSAAGLPRKIQGIRMEILLKNESWDEEAGRWETRSPLLKAWRRTDLLRDEYSWAYSWQCPGPHIRDDGKPCEGGRKHRLGKGWEEFAPWKEEGGVTRWIDRLIAGEIGRGSSADVRDVLGDPFEGVFVCPMPYYRNEDEVKSWVRQTTAQERKVIIGMGTIKHISSFHATHEIDGPGYLAENLDIHFPQHRRSCNYPTACDFKDLCFGPIPLVQLDPISTGLYKPRVPHHEKELVAVIKAQTFQEQTDGS